MAPSTSARVDRVANPSRADFDRHWVERNLPVVITDAANRWPAFTKWTPQYLRATAGDAEVAVHYEESGNFQRWYTPSGGLDKSMRLAEFLDILTAPKPNRQYYMSEHNLSAVSKALLADVNPQMFGAGEPKLFLGRDTCMPLHYHSTTEAVLCQLTGSKEVLLYSPDQYGLLYPYPWHSPAMVFSRIDGREQVQAFTSGNAHLALSAPEKIAFPKFQRARPTVVHLQPGEVLFIPVHWWHLTTAPGFQVNVSAFWPSRVRRYRFPRPGLQVMAHEAMRKVRIVLRPGRKAASEYGRAAAPR